MTETEKSVIIENIEFTVNSELITNTTQKEEIVKWEVVEGNLPTRNRNPLSITCGRSQDHWIEEGKAVCKPVGDGRKFMRYATAEIGFKAAYQLLTSSYSELIVEDAMRKWSGGGYGNEFNIPNHKIKDLSNEELDKLIHLMAKREGFKE